ncbi:hypothetical protein [[Pseudomonas] boreopolis]|uniref:hypothetical protein n=1 Tax=Xanthomonas boreopolis TaxID=86183 RepID=UPI003D418EE3
MVAAFRPMSPMEPQLTAAQEARGWAVLDALDAAKAAGDDRAKIDAIGAFMDWQFAVGLLTRERWRKLAAPHLLDAIGVADTTVEGRVRLQKMRDAAVEALNGDDYEERTSAALFILCVDGVQNPRRREERRQRQLAARNGVAFVAENMWPCLESGHWAPEDVEGQLIDAVEMLDALIDAHEGDADR